MALTDPKDIREQINKLGTDMTSMINKAREEKRELTDEEKRTFDKMDRDREELIADERRALVVASLEETQPRLTEERQAKPNGQQQRATAGDHIETVRAWLQAGSDIPLTQKQVETARRFGVNPASKRLVLNLPAFAMRSLDKADVERWEERALSTLTSTSPEDGSYLIAKEMIEPLERAMLTFGSVRRAASVRRTRTGADWPFPTSDDTGNKGYLLAENTQTVKKDPVFGQLVLGSFKFSSKEVLVSRELMQDSNENLGDLLGSILGERIGRIQEDYFTTGTGTGEPKGIVTAATSTGTALAAKTPTYAELVATEHGVDPAYRSGASWMFHDTMLAEIKKIVDQQNRPVWLPSMSGGAPDRILGYPYFINQSMAVAAASGSGKSILFGALNKYIVRDVREVELFRLDELYAESYQVAFVAFARADGDLLDAGTHPVVYTANKS